MGGPVSFTKKGEYILFSKTKSGTFKNRIPNTQLGPSDGLNLISLGQLDSMGYCYRGGQDKIEVYHPKEPKTVLISAHRTQNNMYVCDEPMVNAIQKRLKPDLQNVSKTGPISTEIPDKTEITGQSDGNNHLLRAPSVNPSEIAKSRTISPLRASNLLPLDNAVFATGHVNEEKLHATTPSALDEEATEEKQTHTHGPGTTQTNTCGKQKRKIPSIDEEKQNLRTTVFQKNFTAEEQCEPEEPRLVTSEELLRAHEQRAHCNSQDVLRRLNWKLKKGHSMPRCTTCMITKAKRSPMPKSATVRSKIPGEKWHLDIVPVTHMGTKGERYYLLAVDDCSRVKWEETMNTKDGTLEAIEKLRSWALTKFRRPIRRLQMDSDSLFKTDQQFKQWMIENHIDPQWSAPYTQSQNGVVERHRYTIGDAVRATHRHANNTSWRYWPYSNRNAIRLLNDLPTSANDGETPLERANLHYESDHPLEEPTLFCKAIAFIDPKEKQRSQHKDSCDRGRECMYLGKAEGNKSYLVEDLQTGAVLHRRIVTFFEDEFPRGRNQQEESWDEREEYWRNVASNQTTSQQEGPTIPSSNLQSSFDEPAFNNELELSMEFGPTTDIDDQPHDDGADMDHKHADIDDEGENKITIEPDVETSPSELFTPRRSKRQYAPSSKNLDNIVSRTEGGAQLMAIVKQLKEKVDALSDQKNNTTKEAQEYNKNLAKIIQNFEDPKDHDDAMNGPLREEFIEAEIDEMKSMYEHKVLKLIKREDVPKGEKIMGSRMLYKVKRNPDRSFDKAKCRLIYQGLKKLLNIPFSETFTSAIRAESLRILLALAVQYDLNIDKLDIKTFYLYGKLKKPIYMNLPKGLEEADPKEFVYEVDGNIYGNPEAGQVANKDLVAKLKEYGFEQCTADESVFIKTTSKGFIILGDYVDDLLMLSDNDELRANFLKYFSEKYNIKHEANPSSILGLQIDRDFANKTMKIHQSGFIDKTLEKAGMKNSKSVSTPATPKAPPNQRPTSKLLSIVERQRYQQKVGDLIWLLKTRPDIYFAVSNVCRKMQNPTQDDDADVKRIHRYLQGTKTMGIIYSKTNDGGILTSAADASFADREDGRSTQGYQATLAGAPVIFKSTIQRLPAQSTTEAEIISCSDLSKEIKWARHFMKEIGFPQDKPTELLQDNQAALKLSKNAIQHARTKHFRTRQALIRDLVVKEVIQPEYAPTEEMPADIYTKALHAPMFTHWRKFNQGE
jgi:hypothetical protein